MGGFGEKYLCGGGTGGIDSVDRVRGSWTKFTLASLAALSKVDEGGANGFFGIGAAYVSPLVTTACGGLIGKGGNTSVSGLLSVGHGSTGPL